MKRAKWVLLVLPLLLLGGAVVVAKNRADERRVILANAEFRRALDNHDAKGMIHWLHLGANPNMDGLDGCSAMDWIAVNSYYIEDLGAELVRARADVNRMNTDGSTALGSAIRADNEEGAIFLLAHGARADVLSEGKTPLLLSARQMWMTPETTIHLIPVLLKHGADANKRWGGQTAYDIVKDFRGTPAQNKQRQHVLALLRAAMKHPKTPRVG